MPSPFTQDEVEFITSTSNSAGKIAKDYFTKKNFEIWQKEDGSNVTSADLAVSNYLTENLSKKFPNIPIISEEKIPHGTPGETFFLIDPIDGTSSFIKNNEEFAICVALIENAKATFGLIYSPLFEGRKMAFSNHLGQVVIRSNQDEQIISKKPTAKPNKLRVLASTLVKDSSINDYISEFHPTLIHDFSITKLSSALKFIFLLENRCDLYLHFRKSREWDTAAGQALVELIGGKVKTLIFTEEKCETGDDLTYKKTRFSESCFHLIH